jgi:hypothetical protein
MVLWNDSAKGLVKERDHMQAWVLKRPPDDCYVEPAGLEIVERHPKPALIDVQLGTRAFRAKPSEDGREDAVSPRRDETNPQPP